MILGIDLGTTFSAVACMDENNTPQIIPNLEGKRTMPSVVLFESGEVIVGEEAKQNSVVNPLNVCQLIKRQMGDKQFLFITEDNPDGFTPEEVSAMILRELKKAAEQSLGQEIAKAVITVPAYFSDAQRKATQDAGKIANLDVVGIINEPTAAAIAYCYKGSHTRQTVLVFDFGGGTFDVTILTLENNREIEIIATDGENNLGGFDFDNEIMEMVTDAFEENHNIDLYEDTAALQELRGRAEQAKISLSSKTKTTLAMRSQGATVKLEITREEFEKRTKEYVDTAQNIMEKALNASGRQWSDLDKIILVGGSSRIPAVQEMIERVTGIVPSHELHPDEAVAMGAACYASILDTDAKPTDNAIAVKVSDVNSHSVGIVLHGNGLPFNQVLIPKNTKIPTVKTHDVSPTSEGQTGYLIQITEGESRDISEVTIIGEAQIETDPMSVKDNQAVEAFCDTSGIIHVTLSNKDTGKLIGELTVQRKANLTDAELQEKMDRISKL